MSGQLPKPSSSKVVRITRNVTVGKQVVQVVDAQAIQSVFGREDVKHCPVAIYSIAGELRKGKSFFFNLLMRYLEFRGMNKASEWKDNAKAVLNQSFEWRGGVEGHTQGILVWSEPFWFEHKEHKKVAVFLMDTQGVFDKDGNKFSDSALFSLSTFLSSCQIYNIKDKISSAHLEQLRIFSSYGKQIYGNKLAESCQTFLFLMRDWQELDYDLGMDGGAKYVEEVLKSSMEQSTENRVLCENIRSTFKYVKCALLPYPGNKVVRRRKVDPPATIGDIDPEFLEVAEEIFQGMFETIELRMMTNLPADGEDIVNLATILSNKIEQNKFGVDALIEAFSTTVLTKLVGKCEELLYGKIQSLENSNISNENPTELHKSFVNEVMDYFHEEHKSGVNPLMAQCATDFENTLYRKEFLLHNYYEMSKIGVAELYQAVVDDCSEAFLTVSKDKYKGLVAKMRFVTDDMLNDALQDTRKFALHMFEEVVKDEVLNDEIHKHYIALLE